MKIVTNKNKNWKYKIEGFAIDSLNETKSKFVLQLRYYDNFVEELKHRILSPKFYEVTKISVYRLDYNHTKEILKIFK